MKILQVVRQYLPGTGGMETYVSSLGRELRARGHQSDVATLDYLFKSNQRLPAYERIDGGDVIRLPSSGNPRYFLAPRLLELLPRYDVIHVHGVDFFVDLLGAGRQLHGKPVVLSTHGGFFHTAWYPAFKKAYFHSLTRLALRGVDRVIASSPQDEELFRAISKRVTLVENGIDYQLFSAVEKQPIPDTMLFVGRLSKNKRVDLLLAALARLRTWRPQAQLTIAGPDWEGLLADLRHKTAALNLSDAVNFTGTISRKQLLAEMSMARLFVSASGYEAFGLSTVEAMASGTVPVVQRIQAFTDIIDEGEDGFLTDFTNTELAAETLRAALELPDKRLREMGELARSSAARYDWRDVAGKIETIYGEVLSATDRNPGDGQTHG
ncbi:MAG: glycosyltransferase family 4 protein [Thermoleophilia bacterium]